MTRTGITRLLAILCFIVAIILFVVGLTNVGGANANPLAVQKDELWGFILIAAGLGFLAFPVE